MCQELRPTLNTKGTEWKHLHYMKHLHYNILLSLVELPHQQMFGRVSTYPDYLMHVSEVEVCEIMHGQHR